MPLDGGVAGSHDVPGSLRRDCVHLPGSNVTLEIERPDNFDLLLDAAVDDPEQNLPYWAELWPSGIALAAYVLEQAELVRGRRVLELGCGLGVTATAAMRVGADLLVTDYAPEALALCARNTARQAGASPRGMQLNWRHPDSAFLAEAPWGIVLAADVLYEARDVAPLLHLAPRLVAPDGELWLAEPGRAPAAEFLTQMAARGWHAREQRYSGPWPDPDDNAKGVIVRVHRLWRE